MSDGDTTATLEGRQRALFLAFTLSLLHSLTRPPATTLPHPASYMLALPSRPLPWHTTLLLFMLLLMLISQTPTQASDTKRRPVVLVPGLYGSSLYALEHDGSDLPPPPEAILEGRRIWPPRNGTLAREDIAMLACSCDSIASITQPWSTDDANWGVCHSSVPGFVVLPPSRRSGLYALCDFDDDPNEQSHYMTTLVRHLEALGYVEGETLFGFPYDWRQSVELSARQLHAFILKTTGGLLKPVDIISHSLGGLVVQYAQDTLREDFSLQLIHRHISLGAPYYGIGALWTAWPLYGEARRGFAPSLLRTFRLTSPSTYELIARSIYYNDKFADRTQTKVPTMSYISSGDRVTLVAGTAAANVIASALVDPDHLVLQGLLATSCSIPYQQAVDQSIARIKKLDESNPIGVTETFVVYGVLQDTPHSLEFPNDIHDDITKLVVNDQQPFPSANSAHPNVVANANGDGTVTAFSATGDRVPLAVRMGFQVSHERLVDDEQILNALPTLLGISCLFEGYWNVSIDGCPKDICDDDTLHVKQRGWMVTEAEYTIHATAFGNTLRGTLVGSFGNATFEWVQSDDCLSWTGFWQYPWSNKYAWHGSRVIHNECVDGTTKECTDLPAGLHHALEAVRECRFGSWQSECFITKCSEGYVLSTGLPDTTHSCASEYFSSNTPFNNQLVVYLLATIICGAIALVAMVGTAIVYRRYRKYCCSAKPSPKKIQPVAMHRSQFAVIEPGSDDDQDVYDEQDSDQEDHQDDFML